MSIALAMSAKSKVQKLKVIPLFRVFQYPPWHRLFILPYTLECMVARTTNALAVAKDTQLSGKHWLIESWYKSVSRVHGICTLQVVICI